MIARFYTQPAAQATEVPWNLVAPVQGMDGTVPIFDMRPGVGTLLYNIYPSEYGCQTRPGYRTWAQNVSAGTPVKTVIPFSGQLGEVPSTKLFVTSSLGIYDVTAQGQDNPPVAFSFSDISAEAGFASFVHFAGSQGSPQYLMLADSRNGLIEYDSATNTWYKLQAADITGVDVDKIAFVTIHKGRLWFIERGSPDAWYMAVGARRGAATRFQFGTKMRQGGTLSALYTWSIDGGAGIDDYLLAYSQGGDVLAYQGSDPSQASTWDLVGNWHIGRPPKGRRIAAEVGGDTVILSTYGLTSAAALLQGVDPTRVERNVTGKITRLVRSAIRQKKDLDFWQTVLLPEAGLLLINTPKRDQDRHIQFVLNLNRVSEDSGGGWGLWRDVPATNFATYNGTIFFSTEDGRVCQMIDSLDAVDLSGSGGTPVQFSLLTGFSYLGAPAIHKQVNFVRANFMSGDVSASLQPVYDYRVEETVLPAPPPPPPPPGSALWDTALWDVATWSGAALLSSSDISVPSASASTVLPAALWGGAGYGRTAAIALRGETSDIVTLVGFEGTYTPWDFL